MAVISSEEHNGAQSRVQEQERVAGDGSKWDRNVCVKNCWEMLIREEAAVALINPGDE